MAKPLLRILALSRDAAQQRILRPPPKRADEIEALLAMPMGDEPRAAAAP
mgnify:CR=1 FL=1